MATQYSAIYTFGDSLSDDGNDSIATSLVGDPIPVSPPYYLQSYGLFTAAEFSDGPVWVQDLDQNLGLTMLEPSLYFGNDFAFGGAEATVDSGSLSGLEQSATSLSSQLVQFEGGGGGPSSALYTLSIGTNDVYAILQDTSAADLAKMESQVGAAVSSEMSFISSLAGDGAKSLLVLDVADVGKMPVTTEQGSASLDALGSQLANLYNVELNADLQNYAQANGLNIQILPLFSLEDEAVADPASFGLTNGTDPAWTGDFTSASSGTEAASPNTYVFWDSYHPTEPVQQLIAQDAQSLATNGTQLYGVPTFQLTDVTNGQSSVQYGTVAQSTTTNVQGQFTYPGTDSVAISANSSSVLLQGGPANTALQATSGSNILDGGTASNFLVGGTGADGGIDQFNLDASGDSTGWDTLVNFHENDSLTLQGFNPSQGSWHWDGVLGAPGYTGATLTVDMNGADRMVTFAGISAAQEQFLPYQVGTTLGGQSYLLFGNEGV